MAAEPTRINFFRHGESISNTGAATSDPASIPLTEHGRNQAKQIAQSYGARPTLIVVSSYQRTWQTAARGYGRPRTKAMLISMFRYLLPAPAVRYGINRFPNLFSAGPFCHRFPFRAQVQNQWCHFAFHGGSGQIDTFDLKPSSARWVEKHRANPGCASCHRLMDPSGFALENFNGAGDCPGCEVRRAVAGLESGMRSPKIKPAGVSAPAGISGIPFVSSVYRKAWALAGKHPKGIIQRFTARGTANLGLRPLPQAQVRSHSAARIQPYGP